MCRTKRNVLKQDGFKRICVSQRNSSNISLLHSQDGEEIKRQLVVFLFELSYFKVLSCLAPSTAQIAEMSNGKALVELVEIMNC